MLSSEMKSRQEIQASAWERFANPAKLGEGCLFREEYLLANHQYAKQGISSNRRPPYKPEVVVFI